MGGGASKCVYHSYCLLALSALSLPAFLPSRFLDRKQLTAALFLSRHLLLRRSKSEVVKACKKPGAIDAEGRLRLSSRGLTALPEVRDSRLRDPRCWSSWLTNTNKSTLPLCCLAGHSLLQCSSDPFLTGGV
eukprot:3322481-Rhodomonas_salina.3